MGLSARLFVCFVLWSYGFCAYALECANLYCAQWERLIGADYAYHWGYTGNGVKIAILDSGMDYSHLSLRNNVLVNAGYNALDGGRDIYDEMGHGTAMAGIAGGNISSGISGYHGVAYNAQIIPIKAIAPNKSDNKVKNVFNIADGINYAVAAGADITNMSLQSNYYGHSVTNAEREALQNAAAHDKIIVTSVGNAHQDTASWPASLAAEDYVYGHMVVVAALDAYDRISNVSNACGAQVMHYCITAPGENVVAPFPDYVNGIGKFRVVEGSSVAAAVVSGSLAIIKEAYPYLSARDVLSILFRSATKMSGHLVDEVYGNGKLNLVAALMPMVGVYVATGNVDNKFPISDSVLSISKAFNVNAVRSGLSDMIVVDGYTREFALSDIPNGSAIVSGYGNNSLINQDLNYGVGAGVVSSGGVSVGGKSSSSSKVFSGVLRQSMHSSFDRGDRLAYVGLNMPGLGMYHIDGFSNLNHSPYVMNNMRSANVYAFGLRERLSSLSYGVAGAVAVADDSNNITATEMTFSSSYQSGVGVSTDVVLGVLGERSSFMGSYGSGAMAMSGNSANSFVHTSTSYSPVKQLQLSGWYGFGYGGMTSGGNIVKRVDGVFGSYQGVSISYIPKIYSGHGRFVFSAYRPWAAGSGAMEFAIPVARDYDGGIVSSLKSIDLKVLDKQVNFKGQYIYDYNDRLNASINLLHANNFNNVAGSDVDAYYVSVSIKH